MSKINASDKGYALGHSKEELERLEKHAKFYSESTHNFLVSAGITKGMRVLDFGAGAGDTAILISELVGESGQVIAVDRSAEALEWTKHRMANRGIKNVATLVGDEYRLAEVFQANKVDAVVTRLVLIFQKDLFATFGKLVENVRPGGIVAFQEPDLESGPWARPALPLMAKVYGWFTQIYTAAGMHIDIGIQLSRVFDQAGIQARHIVRQGVIESGPDATGYHIYADFIRTALPIIQKNNIATPEEIELETLYSRLRDEAIAYQAFLTPFYFAYAYGRMPA
jgi:SAM-dependent methyltransferase